MLLKFIVEIAVEKGKERVEIDDLKGMLEQLEGEDAEDYGRRLQMELIAMR
jgi:hypothetical protein